jgi:hypothetical protein
MRKQGLVVVMQSDRNKVITSKSKRKAADTPPARVALEKSSTTKITIKVEHQSKDRAVNEGYLKEH